MFFRRLNARIFEIFLLALAGYTSLLTGMRAKNEQFSSGRFCSDVAILCVLCFLNHSGNFACMKSSTLFPLSRRGEIRPPCVDLGRKWSKTYLETASFRSGGNRVCCIFQNFRHKIQTFFRSRLRHSRTIINLSSGCAAKLCHF